MTDESGAVTVDWVVLSAGIVTMSILLLTQLRVDLSATLSRILNDASARVMQE